MLQEEGLCVSLHQAKARGRFWGKLFLLGPLSHPSSTHGQLGLKVWAGHLSHSIQITGWLGVGLPEPAGHEKMTPNKILPTTTSGNKEFL